MDRNELINDVVRVYFEGGDWKGYAKELAREVVEDEHNTSSPDSMCNSISGGVGSGKQRV